MVKLHRKKYQNYFRVITPPVAKIYKRGWLLILKLQFNQKIIITMIAKITIANI